MSNCGVERYKDFEEKLVEGNVQKWEYDKCFQIGHVIFLQNTIKAISWGYYQEEDVHDSGQSKDFQL